MTTLLACGAKRVATEHDVTLVMRCEREPGHDGPHWAVTRAGAKIAWSDA